MSFDQFQRYKTVQLVVDNLKKQAGLLKVSILEIGGNGQCNLEELLPEEEIQYSNLTIPEERAGDDRFIALDGTDMPQVADGAYDVVIALDVFEHVPEERREKFLKETYRVARHMAILCFPFANGRNEAAEKRVNGYYKAIYGKDHIWLEEHIENGLPDWEKTEEILHREKIGYSSFEHGDILLWEEWMKALFGSYDILGITPYLSNLEEYYEQDIYYGDVGKSNYRIFLLMGKEKPLAEKMASCMKDIFTGRNRNGARECLLKNLQDLKTLCAREACRSVKSYLYVDNGSGYSEDNKLEREALVHNQDEISVSYEYQLPQPAVGFRFDPVEDCGCLMSEVRISSNQGELSFLPVGGFEHGGSYIFPGNDPQLSIPADGKEIEWLRIEARIRTYPKEKELMLAVMDRLVRDSQQRTEEALQHKENALCELEFSRRENDRLLAELNRVRAELLAELDRVREELTLRIHEVTDEKDELFHRCGAERARADLYEGAYQGVINSKSWKLTAPLRKLFGKEQA